jgi:ribosomal protein S18 acetylase RimI-like enzyme
MQISKVVNDLTIVEYSPAYKSYFKALNIQWLEAYFTVEALDDYVLSNPEEAILNHGGKILFALLNGEVVGTVGIKVLDEETCEITKMAVDPAFRGKGYGKILCAAAIEHAKQMPYKNIILYTSSILKNAIHIYEQLGFQHISFEKGLYARGDVKMIYVSGS